MQYLLTGKHLSVIYPICNSFHSAYLVLMITVQTLLPYGLVTSYGSYLPILTACELNSPDPFLLSDFTAIESSPIVLCHLWDSIPTLLPVDI